MGPEEAESEYEWIANDIGRMGRLMADWRPWPLVVALPTVGLTLLFQVPLIPSLIGGAAVGGIIAVVGIIGERTVAARVATTKEELAWLDRGGRLHRIPLWRVRRIQALRWDSLNVVYYLSEDGNQEGLGVGNRVAERIRRALSRNERVG